MARDDIGGSCWCQGGDFWNPCQGASACTSAVPIENKRLGRRSKAKYFTQEMARRRVVSNGWTQNRARWSSVIIQLVKNAMRYPPTKNKFHCIEHQLFAENAQVCCRQFPWSPEDPIQFAKSCAKLFQTRINSLGPFNAICQKHEKLLLKPGVNVTIWEASHNLFGKSDNFFIKKNGISVNFTRLL